MLGLAVYYWWIVRNFAGISSPLHTATFGNGKIEWKPEVEEGFGTLKVALTSASVLAFPDFDEAFVVETDAYSISLGSALSQKKAEGKIHLIEFANGRMKSNKRNDSLCKR